MKLGVSTLLAAHVGAAAAARQATGQSAKYDERYIVAPGGYECPEECGPVDNLQECKGAAAALGLPCASGLANGVISVDPTTIIGIIPFGYTGFLSVFGITQMTGRRVDQITTGGTPAQQGGVRPGHELHAMWSDGDAPTLVTRKSDEVETDIGSMWDAADKTKVFYVQFLGPCATKVLSTVRSSLTSTAAFASHWPGGCSWSRTWGGDTNAKTLIWNNFQLRNVKHHATTQKKRDMNPWEQVNHKFVSTSSPLRDFDKKAIAGFGTELFRICKCKTSLPQYIGVVHAQCAPSCAPDFDVCTQHSGCSAITSDWDKCKAAATALNLRSRWQEITDRYDDWNKIFTEELEWRKMWGGDDCIATGATGYLQRQLTICSYASIDAEIAAESSSLCTGADPTYCIKNPMWEFWDRSYPAPGATGHSGGISKLDYRTLQGASNATFTNGQWIHYDGFTSVPRGLAPPFINFAKDPASHAMPTAAWEPHTSFLNKVWVEFDTSGSGTHPNRPKGCTFNADPDWTSFYLPFDGLAMRAESRIMSGPGACCPNGTAADGCVVSSCSAQPCLGGNQCTEQPHLLNQLTFAICDCSGATVLPTDPCLLLDPCGQGQVCTDIGGGSYNCSCGGQDMTNAPVAGCPTTPPAAERYFARPAEKECYAGCHRIVDSNVCAAAATELGLPDTTPESLTTLKHLAACGCHYQEHGLACTSDNGCLMMSDVTAADAQLRGGAKCSTFEPADAHDVQLCDCGTVPDFVAVLVGQCPSSCQIVQGKQDCWAAATYIGLDRIVHETQSNVSTLYDDTPHISKIVYPNYTNILGGLSAHDDADGLGPVLGDGPARWSLRPPGCHYRRRANALTLPNGSHVDFPHLWFNQNLSSTVAATPDDMLLCDCRGAGQQAPTPAPTWDPKAYAELAFPVGEQFQMEETGTVNETGKCLIGGVLAENTSQALASFEATFHACIEQCAVATLCRAVQFYLNPTAVVGSEGVGICTPIKVGVSDTGVEGAQAAPGFYCFTEPPPTPAPTPVPSFPEAHLGGVCNQYCCKQPNRDQCCGGDVSGNLTGCANATAYCIWTAKNTCERNCYPRGGCVFFRVTLNCSSTLNQTAMQDLIDEIAHDANVLLGSDPNTVIYQEHTQNLAEEELIITFRCEGCGNGDTVVDILCFSGSAATVDATLPVGPNLRAKEGDTCMELPPDGIPTEAQPKDELGGKRVLRVDTWDCNTTEDCVCVPEVSNVTVAWVNGSWVPRSLPNERVEVTGSELEPAYSNDPPLNKLSRIPLELQSDASHGRAMYMYRMPHCVPAGTQFNISCPLECGWCDVYIVHYQQPPCSTDVNGGYPAALLADGWQARSCAPCFMGPDCKEFYMVAYRRQIEGGKHIVTPPVCTPNLCYFNIFAGKGVCCEDNVKYPDAESCNAAGGTCRWKDGLCVSDWCPKQGEPTTSAPAPVRPFPGKPVCAPGSDVGNGPFADSAELLAALHELENTTQNVNGAYGLIQAGVECSSDDVYLGTVYSVENCAKRCKQTPGCQTFIYGNETGKTQYFCYMEYATKDDCPQHVPNHYDFYTLLDPSDSGVSGFF